MLNKDGHEQSPTPHALRRCSLAYTQLAGGVILGQTPDVGVNEASDQSSLQLSTQPQPLSLPRRDPRHHETEISHPSQAFVTGHKAVLGTYSCPTNTKDTMKYLFQGAQFWSNQLHNSSNQKNSCGLYCPNNLLGTVFNALTHGLVTEILVSEVLLLPTFYS